MPLLIRSFLILSLFAGSIIADEFRVIKSFEKTEESILDTLTILTDKERFVLVPPRNCIQRVDAEKKSLVFESTSGQSVVSLLFTTNSPAALPDDGTLRTNITKIYPGAEILQSSRCLTRPEPGLLFELKRPSSNPNDLTGALMIQHAFVPTPEGLVEIKYSANTENYKRDLPMYRTVLMTFHTEPKILPK